jgi:endonuclease YncB( thermonuclease family)
MVHRIIIIAAVLLGLPASPVMADAIGPACIIDGDTVMVNGKRRNTQCVGGTLVRMAAIDAPELKQTCGHSSGRDVLCGRAAASFLLQRINGRTTTCRGNSKVKGGYLLATCFVGRVNLNALMVREGWAVAKRSHSETYAGDEDAARKARKGLWQLDFVPPGEWRKGRRRGK